nr:two pore domain potassium channel family protein [Actinomycetota bacterium]
YVEDENISTWDGVWWAVTTMTTVGYGDLFPKTTEGRVVAMAVMIVGIGFIAILTAALAERFLSGQVREEAAEVVAEVEGAEAELLTELRTIRQRLQELEASVERTRKS